MKTLISILLLSTCYFFMTSALAQNLVLNPSFEQAQDCVIGDVESDENLSSAVGWYSPTGGTANHYHPCHTSPIQNFTPPDNFIGYQTPNTGIAYAGILCMQDTSDFGGSYREYLQTELSQPLEEGIMYEVGFYCVLSESSVIANNKLGAYFSEGALENEFSSDFGIEPQMEGLEIITDTMDWTLVWGTFIAEGGETHLTIGNHRDYQNTDYVFVGEPNFFSDSYYFIDDVYVNAVPTDNVLVNEEPKLNVYPNPCTNSLTISNHELVSHLRILSVEGEILMDYSDLSHLQLEIDFEPGVYLLLIKLENGMTENHRIIVE